MADHTSKPDPIVLLVLGTALLMGAGSMVFTLLPSLQAEVGFATWGFGLIAGVFFAASLIAQLVLARYADRGLARALLVAAIALGATSLLWMSVADSLLELTLARGMGGLATGCWGPAARASAIARHPDRTARRLSYIAMGDTGGLVVGPLLGSFLAAVVSLRATFVIFACLVVAMTPVLFLASVTEREPSRHRSSISAMIRRRPVQQAVLLAITLFLPVGLYETVWGKHISNLGGSTTIIAVSVASYGLPYMLVAPLGGHLGDRIGPGRVAAIGAIGVAAMTVLTGLPRNYWVLLPLGVVEAAISAIAFPNALAAMSLASSPEEQATGQGLAGAASIAGAGVMALIAGPAFEFGGATFAFASTGLVVIVGAALAYSLDPSALARRPQPVPDRGGVATRPSGEARISDRS